MNVIQTDTAFVTASDQPTTRGRTSLAVEASVRFRTAGWRTFLAHQFTPHPFHITRPFYLAGDPVGMATLYLQSSSGGLYGDDELDLSIATEPDARAHVTSQASTMVPASYGRRARFSVHLALEAGSTLEYVPDPLILFDGADAETTLDVSVGPRATAIVADAVVLHNPAGGPPLSGRWTNTVTVWADGEATPRLVERQRLDLRKRLALTVADDGDPLAGSPCYGAVYRIGADTTAAAATLTAALAMLAGTVTPHDQSAAFYWGVSPLARKGIVAARFLCRDGAILSAALEAAWLGARRACGDGQPAPRRK